MSVYVGLIHSYVVISRMIWSLPNFIDAMIIVEVLPVRSLVMLSKAYALS